MKNFCLFVLIFLIPTFSYPQGSATGCLITDAGANYNKVYTSKNLNLLTGGHALYNNTTSTSLSTDYCSWQTVSVTGNTCGVCSLLGLCALGVCACVGTVSYGFEGEFNMVQCNLDDHTWFFGAAIGLFGILIIRKRTKL
ncbi:hypothetical protein [Pedobacter zeae]|uniref:Uncharacterized protein n=1 Tax=Pedobacter zeae TaxID=1737356 RepID=A0A7W6K9R6_9SPHI|nr:hypothetical protein [Pedobacter zeae]MBB4107818.1 hypothetical protein [Pedobacter zeae]GGG96833.1 hypothetical protein GCM10007422_08390 [Pedobacter zeae]